MYQEELVKRRSKVFDSDESHDKTKQNFLISHSIFFLQIDSYLKLCKLHHPDASNNSNLSKDEKVKKFQKINEAYQCLSKPESKMAYDRTGSNSNAQYSNPYANSKTRAYPKR